MDKNLNKIDIFVTKTDIFIAKNCVKLFYSL